MRQLMYCEGDCREDLSNIVHKDIESADNLPSFYLKEFINNHSDIPQITGEYVRFIDIDNWDSNVDRYDSKIEGMCASAAILYEAYGDEDFRKYWRLNGVGSMWSAKWPQSNSTYGKVISWNDHGDHASFQEIAEKLEQEGK